MIKLIYLSLFISSIYWLITDTKWESWFFFLSILTPYFKNEITSFIGCKFYIITPKSKVIKNLSNSKYSFVSSEYINPLILEDMMGSLWDHNGVVNQVDLAIANNSNRYNCDYNISFEEKAKYPIINCNQEDSSCGYQYIGCSPTGIHIVHFFHWAGGSGVFSGIGLFTLFNDTYYGDGEKRQRINLKLIGSIALGDRYSGKITYNFGFLHIGNCIKPWEEYTKDKWIPIL